MGLTKRWINDLLPKFIIKKTTTIFFCNVGGHMKLDELVYKY